MLMGAIKSCMLSYHNEELKSIGVHMSALEFWKLSYGRCESRRSQLQVPKKIRRTNPKETPHHWAPTLLGG